MIFNLQSKKKTGNNATNKIEHIQLNKISIKVSSISISHSENNKNKEQQKENRQR